MAVGEYIDTWNVNGIEHEIHDAGRAEPEGVATLDSSGFVPMYQLKKDVAEGVAILDGEGKLVENEIPSLVPYGKASPLQKTMFASEYGKVWTKNTVSEYTATPMAITFDGRYYYTAIVDTNNTRVTIYKSEALLNGERTELSWHFTFEDGVTSLLSVFVWHNKVYLAVLAPYTDSVSGTTYVNTLYVYEIDPIHQTQIPPVHVLLQCACTFFKFLPYYAQENGVVTSDSNDDNGDCSCIIIGTATRSVVCSMSALLAISEPTLFSSYSHYGYVARADVEAIGASRYGKNRIIMCCKNQICLYELSEASILFYVLTHYWNSFGSTSSTSIQADKYLSFGEFSSNAYVGYIDHSVEEENHTRIILFKPLASNNIISGEHEIKTYTAGSTGYGAHMSDYCIVGSNAIAGFVDFISGEARDQYLHYTESNILNTSSKIIVPSTVEWGLHKIVYKNGVWLALASMLDGATGQAPSITYFSTLCVLFSLDGVTYIPVQTLLRKSMSSSAPPVSNDYIDKCRIEFIGDSWVIMLPLENNNYNLFAVSDFYSLYDNNLIPSFK